MVLEPGVASLTNTKMVPYTDMYTKLNTGSTVFPKRIVVFMRKLSLRPATRYSRG